MKTKAEILESYIHPTKFLSSLSTETGKLAIFQAMSEYAKQEAQDFLEWKEVNGWKRTLRRDVVTWFKVYDPVLLTPSESATTSQLYTKFNEGRGRG